ncbi:MAG: hypothetical protein C0620_09820 [Desulfuromonas sp.]|nr:MAG: hypothetical protein C0620_09820 [Desulfuromonas sp.]
MVDIITLNRRVIRTGGVVLALFMMAPLSANAWHDPMRPQGQPALATQAKPDSEFTVTSILLSQQRRVAVLNGRVVTVGDTIDQCRVVRISPDTVTLQQGDKRYELRLQTAQAGQVIKRKITE